MNLKQIIIDSKNEIKQRPTVITIAFWTGLGHILSNLFILAYTINNLFVYKLESGIAITLVYDYFVNNIMGGSFFIPFLLFLVFVVIWYFILFPIGIAAIVNFAEKKDASFGSSIGKWMSSFFVMLEYNALIFTLWLFTVLTTMMRLFTLWILNSFFIIMIMTIWWIAVLMVALLWPYAKYFIVIEKQWLYQAIRSSVSLTFENFWTTIKARLVEALLYIYFYLRIIIIVLVPFLISYALIYFHILNNSFMEIFLRIIGFLMVGFMIYSLSIVSSFSILYWHKIYKKLTNKKDS